jgi:hypothetical protein
MPSQNALMMQAVVAFAQGCGGAQIDDAAYEWFHGRYFPWITTRKAVGSTPQEVWDQHGRDFLDRFKLIGEKAAAGAGGGTVTQDTLSTSALSVEQQFECPWCPDQP